MSHKNLKHSTITKSVKVKDLKIHPLLKKYGIGIITPFEIEQMQKFSLKPDQVIVTENNNIISNGEALEEAKKLGLPEIDVTVITGLDEDEVIQVIAFKKIRTALSKRVMAELIIELRDYMSKNAFGKKWKNEIPGAKIDDKIGFLFKCSYGTVFNLHDIYKHNTDLLDDIDKGNLKVTEATEIVKEIKDKQSASVHVGSAKKTIDVASDEAPETINDTENVNLVNPNIKATKQDKWSYAGERDMIPCDKMTMVVLKYQSGRTEEIEINGNKACVKCDGILIRELNYNGGRFHERDNSEFHCFTDDDNTNVIEFITLNSSKAA